jgi:hypothetical protein
VRNTCRRRFTQSRAQSRGFEPRWPSIEDEVEPSPPRDRAHPSSPAPDGAPPDPIIDDDRRENTFGLLASLNMLIETKGGFEYTGADCQAWMSKAGFSATRVEHLVGPHSMAIGIK